MFSSSPSSPKATFSSSIRSASAMNVRPEALDLILAQAPTLDPVQGLAFHQLAQQLDDRQHEMGQPFSSCSGSVFTRVLMRMR